MRTTGLIALFILQFALKGSASVDDTAGSRVEFIVRAKALGFCIIEDNWVRTFSAGFELKAAHRFSIVADAVHFRWMHEQEVNPPPVPYDEWKRFDPRNYAAFELRYYPSLIFMPVKSSLYITCFAKFGTRRIYHEPQYVLVEGDVRSMHSDFHDIGPAIGITLGKRFGFDLNMGAAYRQEVKSETIVHINAPDTYTYNVWTKRWLFNIRVNFFLNLSQHPFCKSRTIIPVTGPG